MVRHTERHKLVINIFRFINARRRILQPMLDASNPEQAKAKKPKHASRPPQRFWPFSATTVENSESEPTTTEAPSITTTAPITAPISAPGQTIILGPGSCECFKATVKPVLSTHLKTKQIGFNVIW